MSKAAENSQSSLIYTSLNELYENKILINVDGSNLVLNIFRVSLFFFL